MSYLINSYRYAVAASTIPSISNEYLHYDFSGEQSVITSSANRVSKVTDGFGTSARDLIQATSDNQPLFIADDTNGLGVIDFVDLRYMETASDLGAISQPYTVFSVAEFLTYAEQDAAVLDGRSASNRINQSNHFAIDKVRCNAGANLDSGTITDLDENNHLVTCIYDGLDSKLRVDGTQVAAATVGTGAYAGVEVGMDAGEGGSGWGAKIMEIAIYTAAVNGDDLTNLENYFIDRWGLS